MMPTFPLVIAVLLTASAPAFFAATAEREGARQPTPGAWFKGVYALSSPLALSDSTVFTLTLRIANEADTAALDATIAVLPSPESYAGPQIEDPEAEELTVSVFDPVDLPGSSSAVFSKPLVAPADQYERWQSGEPLRVSITFVDSFGNRRRQHVEVSLRSTAEEVLGQGF